MGSLGVGEEEFGLFDEGFRKNGGVGVFEKKGIVREGTRARHCRT